MKYRTEGYTSDSKTFLTGTYPSLEEALLGLQRTMRDCLHAVIRENSGDNFALIHMWRDQNSPICYTRIHFERIHLMMENKNGAASPSLPPHDKTQTRL